MITLMKHVPHCLTYKGGTLNAKLLKNKLFPLSPKKCRICALFKLDQDVVTFKF